MYAAYNAHLYVCAAYNAHLYVCAAYNTHLYVCAAYNTHLYVSAAYNTHLYVSAAYNTHLYVSAAYNTHPYVCAAYNTHQWSTHYHLASQHHIAGPAHVCTWMSKTDSHTITACFAVPRQHLLDTVRRSDGDRQHLLDTVCRSDGDRQHLLDTVRRSDGEPIGLRKAKDGRSAATNVQRFPQSVSARSTTTFQTT